jgi:hypothetical protein
VRLHLIKNIFIFYRKIISGKLYLKKHSYKN